MTRGTCDKTGENLVRGISLTGYDLVFVITVGANIDPTPVRVGATADEAWTYIHTNSLPLVPGGSSWLLDERGTWRADPRKIEHETLLYWRTKHLFLTRKLIYTVSTNSIITTLHSQWKFTWPF